MVPYRTPNPRVIETDHMRQKLPSVHGDPSHGRSPFYPQQGSRGPLQEMDEDYDMTSPLSESKRRRFNDAPGHYPSSSPSQYSTHHVPQYVRTPSAIGPSHGPPAPYSSTGPLPGPSMIARSGPMPPPPRPSYVHSPRSSVFDESLRLPPLQTHMPTSPTESSSMSTSAFATGLGITQPGHDNQAPDFDVGGVMDISYVNKLGVFNKISPALPAVASMSPGTHTRGAVIAIEGSHHALLKEVGHVVEKVLAQSGECAVKIWTNESSSKARDEDSEMTDSESSPQDRRASVVTVSSSPGVPKPGPNLFGAYLQLMQEWHSKSPDIIRHVTTLPSRPSIAVSSSSSADGSGGSGSGSGAVGHKTEERRSESTDTHATLCQPRMPIALLPTGFKLTISDQFARTVPIADHYKPVDHWQWMATMWRGIVGSDLTIYVQGVGGAAADDEIAKLGGVEFKGNSLCVVRVNEARGSMDERTERRLSFEIMEWVRSGIFRESTSRYARD